MFELHHLSAQDLWDWIRRGDTTPLEATDHFLGRIARLDPGLQAFVRTTAEDARARAAHLGERVPTSRALWGLPTADKDLYDRAGVPTRSGSRSTPDTPATADHPLVRALDDAGAISLGRTATPEFGLSSTTESLLEGPTRNPYDTRLSPGGSSGGAAVAVAAGLVPVAVGSDGGGSVRIPAAATGLVGLKPSRGRVPSMPGRSGLGGLVVAGPLARTVADAGLVLDTLVAPTGVPARSPYALATPDVGDGPFLAAATRGEGRFTIGVLDGSPWDDAVDVVVDPAAADAVAETLAHLEALGHGVEDVAMPRAEYARWFRVAWQASAARLPDVPGLDLTQLEPLTAWLVDRGRALSGVQVLEAMAGLDAFSAALIGAFGAYDAVLTPTLAMPPRPIGWYSEDAEENFADQCRYSPWTSMCNVAGLPAISLPVSVTGPGAVDGAVEGAGLPMGVQLIGRPGGERTLLAIGAQLERRVQWQRRHPPGW